MLGECLRDTISCAIWAKLGGEGWGTDAAETGRNGEDKSLAMRRIHPGGMCIG